MDFIRRLHMIGFLAVLCIVVIATNQVIINVLPTFASTGPTTTASISTQSQQGSNGWYTTGITVLLSASSTIGVKSITFWLDTGAPFTVNANTTSQTFSQNGNHTLNFYATDTNNVVESPTKSISFKIDTVSPVNWSNITETRNGNAHTFDFSATVSDATSGLDPSQVYMQYNVDDTGTTWGYYSTLNQCNSTWNADQWYHLPTQAFASGATTGTISTPAVDYCNNSGGGCDFMKVRIFDLAGNSSDRKICLGSPWLQAPNADVYSVSSISMTADAPQPNATYVVGTGGTVTSFASSNNEYLQNYTNQANLSSVDYTTYFPQVSSKAQSLPSGRLPTANGFYSVTGDLSITSTIFPPNYATTQNFATVVFVSGNLYVNTNIAVHPTSALIFIVKGNINIDKAVTAITAGLISDNQLNSSYNGNNSVQLVINGMAYALNGFSFVRTLGTATNKTTAAEVIKYGANYTVNQNLQKLFSGTAQYNWSEVAP